MRNRVSSRIRKIAAGKVRVHITRRRRRAVFQVIGPDYQVHEFPTRTAALNNLLARLRCWDPPAWRIEHLDL